MNTLQSWAFNMLKTHCNSQFEAVVGMSVDDAMKACQCGDKAVLNKIKKHGQTLLKQNPAACQTAAEWAQSAFSGASAPAEKQKKHKPN